MVSQRELNLEDYFRIFLRRWPLIAVLAVVGGGLGYGIARNLPKRYTSQTLVLVEQPTVPGDYVKPVVSADIDQRLASMQQEILSRSRLEPLIQQFGLYRDAAIQVPTEDLVDRLRTAVSITPVRPMAGTQAQGLPGFTISVDFDDPRLAQQVCSTITSMFMEENQQGRQQQAEQTTQFLDKQLDDAKSKLDGQDAKLAAFKRRYLGSLPDEQQTNLNLLTGLNTQLDAATQALSRAQQDKSFAESMLTQQLAAWQATQTGQNPETMETQLAALQNQVAELKSKYTADHPDVIKAESELEAFKKKMSEAEGQSAVSGADKAHQTPVETPQIQILRTQIHQYDEVIHEQTAQQQEIQNQIKTYEERVQSSPAIEQEYKELTRDYQTALELYNDLLRKRDQSAMATDLERRQEGQQFQVLDAANLPDRPSFPNKSLFATGGFGGGLALGFCLALLIEMRDKSLRTQQDVESVLQLPVLAMVPAIKLTSSKKGKDSAIGAPVVANVFPFIFLISTICLTVFS
jgi:polysaccharide chain length determinant protein (PEP-CTERM system associated)